MSKKVSKSETSDAGASPTSDLVQQKIWDMPVRIFHWVLVISFAFAFYSGENMTFDNIEWHQKAGYLIGGLVIFRVLWGFIGSRPARFSAFFPTPKATIKYVKSMPSRKPSGTDGHNPVGGSSVIAILLLLLAQVGSGLFLYSDVFFEGGPLSSLASSQIQGYAASVHHFASHALFVLVIIHVLAIIFYLVWKKENLIKPMISGIKWIRPDKKS